MASQLRNSIASEMSALTPAHCKQKANTLAGTDGLAPCPHASASLVSMSAAVVPCGCVSGTDAPASPSNAHGDLSSSSNAAPEFLY